MGNGADTFPSIVSSSELKPPQELLPVPASSPGGLGLVIVRSQLLGYHVPGPTHALAGSPGVRAFALEHARAIEGGTLRLLPGIFCLPPMLGLLFLHPGRRACAG